MSSNPIKRDFSKNQIKILKLLFEKEYLQNELQEALNTTAPNLYYHLSRLEGYNLIIKETLHEIGSAKINKISLNPSTREYVQKLLGYKNNKPKRSKASGAHKNNHKNPKGVSNKPKNNYYSIAFIVLLLLLTGIIVSSTFLVITSLTLEKPNPEDVEITANADIFTQNTKTSNINVYDGSGSTPFLRLGLFEFTYDAGGYLSDIYVRFNLSEIEEIRSMVLRLTYYEGYPLEADNNYEVNASLVSNNWVEQDTVWTNRPEYLGISTIIFLHNPNLEREINIDLTSLAVGISDTIISIRLSPYDLSRIRFPAPFKSKESYVITPRLIIEHSRSSESLFWNNSQIILMSLLVVFGSLTTIVLSGIIYKIHKEGVREIPIGIQQDNLTSETQEKTFQKVIIKKVRKRTLLSSILAVIFIVSGISFILWGISALVL